MIYASWEKSLYFSSARIPAQSMQSFMPMKNVAYFNSENDSNDAYVSVWQIFLQGSDFDIDKAYNIGYKKIWHCPPELKIRVPWMSIYLKPTQLKPPGS